MEPTEGCLAGGKITDRRGCLPGPTGREFCLVPHAVQGDPAWRMSTHELLSEGSEVDLTSTRGQPGLPSAFRCLWSGRYWQRWTINILSLQMKKETFCKLYHGSREKLKFSRRTQIRLSTALSSALSVDYLASVSLPFVQHSAANSCHNQTSQPIPGHQSLKQS